MRFATDIVAVNLRDYSHSPQLLTDLGREGYELFDPTGYVFLRKHLALRSTPEVQAVPAQPTPPAPPVVAPEPDDEEEYGPECESDDYDDRDREGSDGAPESAPTTAEDQSVSTFLNPNPGTATPRSQTGDGIDYGALASRVCAELLKRQRRKPTLGLY